MEGGMEFLILYGEFLWNFMESDLVENFEEELKKKEKKSKETLILSRNNYFGIIP